MRSNLPVTGKEHPFPPGQVIVSVTDTKGRITYCNPGFVKMSGFSAEELLGQPHNIVRHPDMPRGVFRFLWSTLERGQECFAYVKNMTRTGDYYWVLANVTPDTDAQGAATGYFSVRRKPARAAVAAVSDLYRQMLDEEKRAGSKDACDASLAWLDRVLAQKGLSYEKFVLSL